MGSQWELHSEEYGMMSSLLLEMVERDLKIGNFLGKITKETNTRLIDWVDHIKVPFDEMDLKKDLPRYNVTETFHPEGEVYKDLGTNLPSVVLVDGEGWGMAIKVENIDRFMTVNEIGSAVTGMKDSSLRTSMIKKGGGMELEVLERRGYDGFQVDDGGDIDGYRTLRDSLMVRDREPEDMETAFGELEDMLSKSVREIGPGRTADAFFWSERRYWERRNSSAMVQWRAQDRFGLGWGNHDHHTFRCSRENYARTMAILERIGMKNRERFYAGDEAGWGAQVLEHPAIQVAVFADVDLSPDEKDGDFPHTGLGPSERSGTVGLWVGLHGESMFQAGLHHLAVLVDFEQAVMNGGTGTMAPFSNFPYLKQCFTVGEKWEVARERAHELLVKKLISRDHFKRFAGKEVIGSHLELIERNDGFKGFNQNAVSDIISRTDPRK